VSDALRKIGRATASHFNVHAVLESVDGDNEDVIRETMSIRTTCANSWDALDAVMTRLCDQEDITAEVAGERWALLAMTVIKPKE
jgi:hypothetical protein